MPVTLRSVVKLMFLRSSQSLRRCYHGWKILTTMWVWRAYSSTFLVNVRIWSNCYFQKISEEVVRSVFKHRPWRLFISVFFFLIWYLKYCLARQNFRVNLSFLTHLYFSYNCNYFSSIAFHAWCYICLKLDAGNLRYFVSIQFLLIILFLCLQKKSVCFELFFAKW